jgi:hypothetical protein
VPVDLPDHPKYIKLKRLIGDAAMETLVTLWGWVRRYRGADGVLTDMQVDDVEIAARWRGAHGELVRALVATKFLDELEGGELACHDWQVHQPWAAGSRDRKDRASKGGKGKAIKAEERKGLCSDSAPRLLPAAVGQVGKQCLPPTPLLSSPFLSNPPPPARDPAAPEPGGVGGGEAAPLRMHGKAALLAALRMRVEARLMDLWPHDWNDLAREGLRKGLEFAFEDEDRCLFERPTAVLADHLVAKLEEARKTVKDVTSPAFAQRKWRTLVGELNEELERRDRSLGRSPPAPGVAAGPPETPMNPEDRSWEAEARHARRRCGGAKNGCAMCRDEQPKEAATA